MRVMNFLLEAGEGIGLLILLVYGVVRTNWELIGLALIIIELIRIRGALTGDEYETFLKAEKLKKT